MRRLALTLVASALLAVAVTPAWANCNPSNEICINKTCERIGTTMIDKDQKNIIACLYVNGVPTWKGNSSNASPTLTTYARTSEGTTTTAKHDFCALTRTGSQAWGSATYRDCNLTRQANGTWTLYAHFQRNSETMSPNYVMCSATCVDDN